MASYATKEHYLETNKDSAIDKDNIEKYLKLASRDIDTLTHNRIVAIGFENLTELQQNIIKEVACDLAKFKFSNKDLLESILSSYSINGVGMDFNNSWNIKIIRGIAIPKDLYGHLEQTGLACRSFRW